MRFNLFIMVLTIAIISSCSSDNKHPYQLTKHQIHYLRVPKVMISIDQNYGARVVSLKYRGRELLSPYTVNPENFGSTFWTSPQSDWQWPPIASFDVKPYDLRMNGTELQFYSEPNKKTGFQIGKYFKLSAHDSSFIITYIIKNISTEEKSVAPWEVTRRIAGGISFFPANPDSAVMKKSNLPGVTVQDGVVWFAFDPKKITKDSKLYGMSSEGWLANVKDSILFLKTFADIPNSKVPPSQGKVEIFASGTKDYIELENHGEYTSLFPADSLVYKVRWVVKPIPSNIDKSLGSKALVNWVRKIAFNNRFNLKNKLMNLDD
jgi:hypothetical protein